MLTRRREFREEVFQAKETVLLEARNQAHSIFGTPHVVCCGCRVKEGIRMVTVRDEPGYVSRRQTMKSLII